MCFICLLCCYYIGSSMHLYSVRIAIILLIVYHWNSLISDLADNSWVLASVLKTEVIVMHPHVNAWGVDDAKLRDNKGILFSFFFPSVIWLCFFHPLSLSLSLSRLVFSCQGSQKELLNLTQQDYMNRIEELNQSLKDAWSSDQKVKALKIVIQVSFKWFSSVQCWWVWWCDLSDFFQEESSFC